MAVTATATPISQITTITLPAAATPHFMTTRTTPTSKENSRTTTTLTAATASRDSKRALTKATVPVRTYKVTSSGKVLAETLQ